MIFAIFDFEEYRYLGSEAFVKNYTKYTSRTDFLGAIILDTVLNYNKEPKAQTLPPVLELAQGRFPFLKQIIDQFKTNQFKGDGLSVIGRQLDQELISEISNRMKTESKYFV